MKGDVPEVAIRAAKQAKSVTTHHKAEQRRNPRYEQKGAHAVNAIVPIERVRKP